MTRFGKYFYGNEISDYGKQYGRVDYATFAKAFDAVLNNDIMNKTWGICGEWEQESGYIDNGEEIEEKREAIEEREEKRDTYAEELAELADIDENDSRRAFLEDSIEELDDQIRILEDEVYELEAEQDEQPEVYQWYIIDDNGARICEEFNEIVYYNSELDMYLWGVTHYGTSWSYVLTDIPCEVDETARA